MFNEQLGSIMFASLTASFFVRHREQKWRWADMGNEAPSVGLFGVGGLRLLVDTRLQFEGLATFPTVSCI